jgi:hypothetical protein
MKTRNPLPAPDLKDLQALADWLCNMAYAVEHNKIVNANALHCFKSGDNVRLSDHAANVRRAIARLKQKDDATAQPQDWGKDE